MKNNIDEKSNEIADLKNYFIEIIPENYIVRIQYNSSKNVDLFVYEPTQDSMKRDKLFGQWDVNFKDYKETPQTDYEKKYHGKTKSLELVNPRCSYFDISIWKSIYWQLLSFDLCTTDLITLWCSNIPYFQGKYLLSIDKKCHDLCTTN